MTPLFALNIYYQLPFLLVVVSLVYAAARHDRWPRILREAVGWIVRMTLFLAALGIGLYVLSTHPHWGPTAAVIGGIGMAIYYTVTAKWFKRWRARRAQRSSPGAV